MPWFLPRLDNHTACDPWEQRLFNEEKENVDLDQSCSHCLADCEYTEYKVETTAAEFRFSELNRRCFQRSNLCSLQALRQL